MRTDKQQQQQCEQINNNLNNVDIEITIFMWKLQEPEATTAFMWEDIISYTNSLYAESDSRIVCKNNIYSRVSNAAILFLEAKFQFCGGFLYIAFKGGILICRIPHFMY